jgi:predicted metal-dependent phosphoesterase TrpH
LSVPPSNGSARFAATRQREDRLRLADGLVDLHAHTIFSDGLFTPEQLVEEAKAVNLTAVGVTDHDAMGGIERALSAGRRLGVEVVPGVELSCTVGGIDVHVLGYYIDHGTGAVREFLDLVRQKRRERAERMVAKLAELGVPVTMARVEELAGGAAIGRPHVAQAAAETGKVGSSDEAFIRYIGHDGPAYFPKMHLSPQQAVGFVHEHGGLAVVAHPGTYGNDDALYSVIAAGADGVEVWHSDHSEKDADHYREIAQKNGLLTTGGSDCHGGRKHGRVYLGQVAIPYRHLQAMKNRLKRR